MECTFPRHPQPQACSCRHSRREVNNGSRFTMLAGMHCAKLSCKVIRSLYRRRVNYDRVPFQANTLPYSACHHSSVMSPINCEWCGRHVAIHHLTYHQLSLLCFARRAVLRSSSLCLDHTPIHQGLRKCSN